jgi:FkbM family methyltransferase
VQDPDGSRDRFFEAAAEFTPLVAVDSLNARFVVSTSDEAVGRRLFRRNLRGEMVTLGHTVAILHALGEAHWTQDTTFLDLGANIGTSTITALRSHSFSRAIACEPEPENYRLLRVNATMNDLADRVLALPVAVSDEARGEAALALDPVNSGGHHVVDESKARETVTVETVSVDYLADRGIFQIDDVGLIWIDAQGYEGHIVSGAIRLVERGVPIVLEFHPKMLRSAGGYTRLEKLLTTRYTHFVDLRHVEAGESGASPSFDLRPASDLPGMAEELAADDRSRFTDILALKLGPKAQRTPRRG